MTSLGTREDLKSQKKEGVVTHKALGLHKYALVQSLLAVPTKFAIDYPN